jgi:hypothetical protein
MNPFVRGAACAVLALATCSARTVPAASAGPAPPPAGPPCAVVELFTSEGCSSCPPADALLAQIDADARATGQRVFPLEFHVDYWDNLGWRDPYSSAAATERQRDYADRLGLDQVYTPQMVINGTSEFVGSNRARAAREIVAALAAPTAVSVSITPAADHVLVGGATRYRVTLRPSPRGAEVVVARVESGLVSKVGRGENGGRTLHHASVVRAFAVATPGPDGAVTVAVGKPSAGGGGVGAGATRATRVIAFAQDRATGAILGATALTAP